MRTLNRPMFRYGGPIKEGIMNGIRENHSDGGKAALVGNSVYPQTDGREHHVKALKNIPKFIKPSYWTKGWTNPGTIGGGIKNWFKNTGQYTGTPTTKQKISRFFDNTSAGKYLAGTTEGKLAKKVWDGKSWVTKPIKAVAEGAIKTPTAVGIGAYALDALPGGEPLLNLDMLGNRNILGQRYDPKTNERIKGTGISSWWEDENKISDKINDTIPKTPEEIEAAKVAAALKAEQAGVAKAEFAETEKQKRIDNYRKIMDIEGMSKDAAYDSLIDASRAVLDNPGTLKEGLKDGTLMSKIIGTTSKRFDKPKDTKDAINTLILKNQMAADTPSTALKDLIAIGIDTPEKQEAYLRTKLGQPSSLSAAEAIVAKSSAATGPSAIAYKAAEMMFGNEFKGNLMDEDSFTESFDEATKMFGKDKRPNEITVGIISQEAKKKGFPPGKYTVGNVVIDLDEEFNVKIIRE